MSIGVVIPAGGGNAVDSAVAYAREAAAAGMASAWFGQRFDVDSVALAGFVGREVPGLAVGSSVVPVFGEAHDRPVLRLREFLTALRSVVDTGSVDLAGETLVARAPMPASVPGGSPLPVVVAVVPAVVTSDVAAAREVAVEQTAFYDRVPSYQRVISLSGAERAADLVVLGDEQAVADEIGRYFDAGATEVVLTQTDLTSEEDRLRTWRLAGALRPTGTRA